MTWYESIEDETFENLQDGELQLDGKAFSGCTFQGCVLTEASFRGTQLSECRFLDCELSAIDLTDALLHSVLFERCRLSGTNFSLLRKDAVGITAEFIDCDLGFTTFRMLDLRQCAFRDCNAREAELVGCDLSKVDFRGTDFSGATFQDSTLTEADFRGAKNYLISANHNRLKGMRVELPEALGLLAGLEVHLD